MLLIPDVTVMSVNTSSLNTWLMSATYSSLLNVTCSTLSEIDTTVLARSVMLTEPALVRMSGCRKVEDTGVGVVMMGTELLLLRPLGKVMLSRPALRKREAVARDDESA